MTNIPFIGKVDDDSIVNLPKLMPFMTGTNSYIGSFQWTSVIPKSYVAGVRLDRCGFAWTLEQSVRMHLLYCPRGATLPFPYAAGAGYFMSSQVSRWLGEKLISDWVQEAFRGKEKEVLQWQKYEDTSLGYWLTYYPHTINHINIGKWVHNFNCAQRGKFDLYRLPSPDTIILHDMKRSAHRYSWALINGRKPEGLCSKNVMDLQ